MIIREIHGLVVSKPKFSCSLQLENFFKLIIFYFWLHWVFVAVLQLSLVAESRGYSLVIAFGLLTVVTSLIAERRL